MLNKPLLVPILVCLMAIVPEPSAAGVWRNNVSSAVGQCQGALPIHDNALRKRPLEILNESGGLVFVSCAFELDTLGSIEEAEMSWVVFNEQDVAVDIACTAVFGAPRANPGPLYITQTKRVGPRSFAGFTREGIEGRRFPDEFFLPPMSISCALPANTGIQRISVSYIEQVAS